MKATMQRTGRRTGRRTRRRTRQRPMQRSWAWIGAGLIVVIGVFVVGGCSSGDDAAGGGGGRGGGGFKRPPTPVEFAVLTPGRVVDRFHAVGTIEAAETVLLVSEIPGIVERLPFREGGHVEQGDLIAQLRDDELAATLDRAEAIREQRQAAYDRVRSVVDRGAGTPQDLDDAAAALKIAEADRALAQARLEKTSIRAPFSGVVGSRRVSPGAFLSMGAPIVDLHAIQELEVRFTVPEQYVPLFEIGGRVEVTVPAFPGKRLDGRIKVINPGLDPETRSAEVIARVPNPGERVKPGMSADVELIFADRPDALTVPNQAVFTERDQMFVYRIEPDTTVARTPVTLGTRLVDRVEVTSGLSAGDRIVLAGHQKLFEGARVFPVPSGARPGGPPSGGPGDSSGGAPGGAPGGKEDGEASAGTRS